MISKFKTIKNIFSYSYFNWDSLNYIEFEDKEGNRKTRDGAFVKFNILFAENGNGKSNFINILKALNGEENIILERHWDYPDEEQKLILYYSDELSFDSTNWDSLKGSLKEKFIVFDKYFVNRYVHSVGLGDHNTPQRKQERGKQILYLGKFIEYNQEINKINQVKNNINEKNHDFLNKGQEELNKLLPEWLDIPSITNDEKEIREIDPGELQALEDKLKENKLRLEKANNAIKNQATIKTLKKLDIITSSFDFNIKKVDSEQKETLHDIDPPELFKFTASRGVKETLDRISHKKSFIKSGLALIDDKTKICPFCEQNIKNGEFLPVVQDYQSIFDEAFLSEEKDINNQLQAYKDILHAIKDLQPISMNFERLNNIQNFIHIDLSIPTYSLDESDREILNKEIQLVSDKEKNILNPISECSFDQVKALAETAAKYRDKYNTTITAINEKIDELISDADKGNLSNKKDAIQAGVNKLEKSIFYINHKADIISYFKIKNQYDKNKDASDSLEKIYQSLKNRIIKEFNDFAKEYFGLIKRYIERLNPSMEIFDILGEGRYSRTSREPAQCGFKVEYNGKDRTANLSEGERQVIALAFFFALINKETNKDKIIILDDPITSFDAGKRKSAAEVIYSETNKFEQLFVFTCDPLFREFCRKEIPDDRNLYYIFNTQRSSSIHYVPKHRETIYQSFDEEFKDIESKDGSNENVVIFGQKLRFCLETKIKEDYFGYSQDNLSNMIKQVAGKGNEKFVNLIDNKDKILRLYNYCNTGGLAHYPRDGSTSWNELKGKIQEYLDLEL